MISRIEKGDWFVCVGDEQKHNDVVGADYENVMEKKR